MLSTVERPDHCWILIQLTTSTIHFNLNISHSSSHCGYRPFYVYERMKRSKRVKTALQISFFCTFSFDCSDFIICMFCGIYILERVTDNLDKSLQQWSTIKLISVALRTSRGCESTVFDKESMLSTQAVVQCLRHSIFRTDFPL